MRVPVVLTVLSAGLYALTFPPVSLGWLAWVALAPWIVASMRVDVRRATVLGLLWGVVAAWGVGWWFPAMLVDYFAVSSTIAWIGFLLAAAATAGIYFAAFGAWLSWLARSHQATPFVVACGWLVCEFLRVQLFFGNPWALSAYSQSENLVVLQSAALAGPWGIGFLVGLVNASVAALVAGSDRLRLTRAAWFYVPAAIAVFCAYGVRALGTDYARGPERTVAIAQGAVRRAYAWRPEYRSLGVARYIGLTREAMDDRPELVVWPENAVSFDPQDQSPEATALRAFSFGLSADLLLGAPRYIATGNTTRYNSTWLVRRGTFDPVYDKRHLLPLAEASLLGWFSSGRPTYDAGTSTSAPTSVLGRTAVFLCSEAMYPDVVRPLVSADVSFLTNLTNTGWFNDPAPAVHHLQATVFRAVEHRRYLVRAASTGISALIDPHGRIYARTAIDEATVLAGTIRAASGATFYSTVGYRAPWAALIVVIVACLRRSSIVKPSRRYSW